MRAARGSLRARYRRAFVPKPRAVEEPVDQHWHRPLAAWLTVALEPTAITPVHVTLASLAAGLACAALVACSAWRPEPWWLTGAAGLLFLCVVLDCADGQLARLRGEATELGRILDGIVDNVVVVAIYAALTLAITVRAGPLWGAVTAMAGVTMPLRLMAYDRLRALFLREHANPDRAASGTDTVESVTARAEAARLSGERRKHLLLRIYLGYCRAQRRLVPDPAGPNAAAVAPGAPGASDMGIARWLGLGTHMALLYGALLAASFQFSALLLLQIVFLLVLNALLVHALLSARRRRAPGERQGSGGTSTSRRP